MLDYASPNKPQFDTRGPTFAVSGVTLLILAEYIAFRILELRDPRDGWSTACFFAIPISCAANFALLLSLRRYLPIVVLVIAWVVIGLAGVFFGVVALGAIAYGL